METRALNQAVRRNLARFPEDFMFLLTEEEASALRSQFVTLEAGRGRYSKYAPLAFTEHGVAMLSAVLNSARAVQMSIVIVRAFVKLRELLASHKDLARKIEQVEDAQKKTTSISWYRLCKTSSGLRTRPPPGLSAFGYRPPPGRNNPSTPPKMRPWVPREL